MTYQESLDYLYGLQKFGIKLGLENIRTFLSRLGRPDKKFKIVLVAGTNGKGSTAYALAAILSRAGYRTGLYTSPHLHSFSERVRVDGEPIPETRIAGLVAEMQPHADNLPLTFFEFTTALALQYFAEQEVEIAVLEVGLGGRLDATNAVEPILSVISPVARDHQQYLGENLGDIAREKAGIMRAGVPVVFARQEPEALEELRAEAVKVGADIVAFGEQFTLHEEGGAFNYEGLDGRLEQLVLGIPGRHQFGNMATALAAAELLSQAGYRLPDDAMRTAIADLTWPGRLEWLAGRTILLDGAHNEAGAKALAGYLDEQGLDNVHWIVGIKADKKSEEILAPVAPRTAFIYCVEPPVEEAVPLEALQRVAGRYAPGAASFASIREALSKARTSAGRDGTVLVAGSLFLVATVRELILEESRSCDTSQS